MREITKSVLKFLIGFLAVLVISVFLTPWLFSFLPFKFDRIFRRLIMIGTLLLVWPLARARRQSLSQMGLGWGKESPSRLMKGFLIGAGMVAFMTSVQWALGGRFWHLKEAGAGHWIGFFLKGFGAGILIGALEEFFFRGFLFLLFKELWNTGASLVMTNLIYALVHFFPKGRVFIGPHPTWVDSLRILEAVVSPTPADLAAILPGIAGLFFFGLVLSFAFLGSRSLYPSIGVHAGAVFSLKLNRRFVPEIAEKMNGMTGTKNLYDGAAGVLILAGMALAAFRWYSGTRKKMNVPKKLLLTGVLIVFLHSSPALPSLWAQEIFEREAQGAPPKNSAQESLSLSEQEEVLPEEVIYSFLRFFPEAAAREQRRGSAARGMWTGKGFHFEDSPSAEPEIFLTSDTPVNKGTRQAIAFRVSSGSEISLIFLDVPPARHLRVFYALADSAFGVGKKPSFVNLEIDIGKKRILQAQANTKGWKQKAIDLTLPFLLHRHYSLTVRVRSVDPEPKNFLFYGYLE